MADRAGPVSISACRDGWRFCYNPPLDTTTHRRLGRGQHEDTDMASRIQGVYCPHMVPFNDDGSINEPELRRLIDYLIAAGISGLYPNGSDGRVRRSALWTDWGEIQQAIDHLLRVDPGVKARRKAEERYIRGNGG